MHRLWEITDDVKLWLHDERKHTGRANHAGKNERRRPGFPKDAAEAVIRMKRQALQREP